MLFLFVLLLTISGYSQFSADTKDEFTIPARDATPKNHFGIEITTSVLPGARITRDAGNYSLNSRLQSSYDLGVNYIHHVNSSLTVSTGLHFVIGKWNFFSNIPDQDVSSYGASGSLLIENKELWGAIRIPLLVEKTIQTIKSGPIAVKAGLSLRYSGLMADLGVGGSIIDSTGQVYEIFNSSFTMTNNKKPWLTFLAGVSRPFVLRNSNILSLGLQADISTAYFFKGNYEITIPNQPVTFGTYKISGSSLGISARYIFTGSNKSLYFSHAKINPQKSKIERKDLLSGHVFNGNHIEFSFSTLYTLKARVKKRTGNHPVSATATAGLALGFKYHVNFNDHYSLIAGPEAIIAGRDLVTSFNKNDFSPALADDYKLGAADTYVADLILSLPVLLERRIFYSKTKYLFAQAGMRLNFSTGADFDFFTIHLMNTNNAYYNAGGWDVYANNDAKPWLSFPLHAGHAWLLKNNNLLQLTLCSNISFTKYVNGTYSIVIPGQPLTEGRYSSTGSYIGLMMSYVFTNTNYRIRKILEK